MSACRVFFCFAPTISPILPACLESFEPKAWGSMLSKAEGGEEGEGGNDDLMEWSNVA